MVNVSCIRALQVLGRHRHPAEADGVREASQSAPADQLLGQHPARHVPLPEVSGLSLRPQEQTGHPGGEYLLHLHLHLLCLFVKEDRSTYYEAVSLTW